MLSSMIKPELASRPSSAGGLSKAGSRPSSADDSRPESARRNALSGVGSVSAASISKRPSVMSRHRDSVVEQSPRSGRSTIVAQGAGNLIKIGGSRGRHNMSEEMKKEYTETFSLLDDLHEGVISAPKLLTAMKILGFEPTAAASDRAVGEPLDLNEFMSFILSASSSQSDWCMAEMEEAFLLFDRENCGYLAPAQFKRTFGRLGEKLTDAEIEDQMDDFDLNDDYNLEKKNFFKMLLSNEQR